MGVLRYLIVLILLLDIMLSAVADEPYPSVPDNEGGYGQFGGPVVKLKHSFINFIR